VHGPEAAVLAQEVTAYLTGQTSVEGASDAALQAIRREVPAVTVTAVGSIVEALVQAGLATSNSEARRLVSANAVSVNGAKVTRENFENQDFVKGRLLLRRGKAFKDSALVELGD